MIKRILLADDNPGLRSALRLLLETRLEFELIVEARDMEHVLAQVEDSRPDCVILDWELPGRPTRERVSVLRTLVPHLKVIAFSARTESKESALAEGADAFISKDEAPLCILEKIEKICQPGMEPKNPCSSESTYPLDQGQEAATEGGSTGEQTGRHSTFSLEEKHTKTTPSTVGNCAQSMDRKESKTHPRMELRFSCKSAVVGVIGVIGANGALRARRERR